MENRRIEAKIEQEFIERLIAGTVQMQAGELKEPVIRTEMTKDEIDSLTNEMKRVFDEKNFSVEKRALFIKLKTEGINKHLKMIGSLDESFLDIKAIGNLTNELKTERNNFLAAIGLEDNSPDYIAIRDCYVNTSFVKNLQRNLIEKLVYLLLNNPAKVAMLEIAFEERNAQEQGQQEILQPTNVNMMLSMSMTRGGILRTPSPSVQLPQKDDVLDQEKRPSPK